MQNRWKINFQIISIFGCKFCGKGKRQDDSCAGSKCWLSPTLYQTSELPFFQKKILSITITITNAGSADTLPNLRTSLFSETYHQLQLQLQMLAQPDTLPNLRTSLFSEKNIVNYNYNYKCWLSRHFTKPQNFPFSQKKLSSI